MLPAVFIHSYYENGATASIDDFYNIDVLDSLIKDLNQLLDICNTTGYKGDLWIGETSSTYHGGSTLFSSTFLSGFMLVCSFTIQFFCVFNLSSVK